MSDIMLPTTSGKRNYMVHIVIVAAMDQNRVIGKNGKVPFNLAKDRKYFKEITNGHAIVMGRKTYLDIGKALPHRRNIVLSRDPHFESQDVEIARSLDECLLMISGEQLDVMIIGGQDIYQQFLPFTEVMIITHVNARILGDTYFPVIENHKWTHTFLFAQQADEKNEYSFSVWRYTKI